MDNDMKINSFGVEKIFISKNPSRPFERQRSDQLGLFAKTEKPSHVISDTPNSMQTLPEVQPSATMEKVEECRFERLLNVYNYGTFSNSAVSQAMLKDYLDNNRPNQN
uniref:Type III secretion system protein n=1 Tax=Bursaphelenchus xylophilus TaxID=6326 RepID=A0A1I7S9F9_BURXY